MDLFYPNGLNPLVQCLSPVQFTVLCALHSHGYPGTEAPGSATSQKPLGQQQRQQHRVAQSCSGRNSVQIPQCRESQHLVALVGGKTVLQARKAFDKVASLL